MRVHNVEENGYPQAVCSVNKLLEIFWSTTPRTCSEEAGDLVSESYDCQPTLGHWL